ncbi:helix-turn-helix domain-containing protein [Pandoraea sp. NPDC087047]|uniref:helix-turn-helix domain-containing protein n=1 Tax=Pandoraea sp. NPDC087047 TaxID=3364390 RepID=UPI00382DF27B
MTALVHRLGMAIRQLRESRGWSQELLAEHASLNRSYVGELERGAAIASIVTVEKIAYAFGVPIGHLLAAPDEIPAPAGASHTVPVPAYSPATSPPTPAP